MQQLEVSKKWSSAMGVGDKLKALCRNCHSENNHFIIQEVDQSGAAENGEFRWKDLYQIIQCCGCEVVAFRRFYCDDSMFNPWEEVYEEEISIFPDPRKNRELNGDDLYFPSIVQGIYRETISAYNYGLFSLCTMGLRSIIEAICINRECKVERNLEKSVENLNQNGDISTHQLKILQLCRTFLNTTFHQISIPEEVEITLALDTIESVLENIYVHPENERYFEKYRKKSSPKKSITTD